MNKCLDAFQAKCIYEPRGDAGLEGFQLNKLYDVQHMSEDKNKRPYYRVYVDCGLDYYETCSKIMFNRHFKKYE